MLGPSPRFGITYPHTNRLDSADVPRDIGAIVSALEAKGAVITSGLLSARPVSTSGSPGQILRLYFATDNQKLYIDHGTGWVTLNADIPTLGADSITQAMLQDNVVGAAELANNAVDTAAVLDAAITFAKLAAALKPSQGAAGADEALRALGTGGGQALPGNHPTATPVASVYAAGPSSGGTYQLAAPAAGTYLIEWGAGKANSLVQGGSATITCSAAGGVAQYADFGAGGPMARGGIVLSNGQVVTFTVSTNNFSLEHLWAKLTRTA